MYNRLYNSRKADDKIDAPIKRFDPKIIVTIGGSHAELNYANFFDSPADYIYHLSGLDSFLKLMDLIDNTGTASPDDIPGICYKEGEGWKVNKKVVETPGDLPPIDRTYFYKNKNRYRYLTFHPSPWSRIHTAVITPAPSVIAPIETVENTLAVR